MKPVFSHGPPSPRAFPPDLPCHPNEIDGLICALGSESVQAVIHGTASFNRHRGLIVALVSEPGIASLLGKSLLR